MVQIRSNSTSFHVVSPRLTSLWPEKSTSVGLFFKGVLEKQVKAAAVGNAVEQLPKYTTKMSRSTGVRAM